MSAIKKSFIRRSTKVIVDTNLLLLLMFASQRRDPSKDTRLSRYADYDLTLMENLIKSFSTLIVTPNILTEFSNQTKGYLESTWLTNLISNVSEEYIASRAVSYEVMLQHLGLTDTILLSKHFDDCCILTDDLPLANYLYSLERNVVYYTQYRDEYRSVNTSGLS